MKITVTRSIPGNHLEKLVASGHEVVVSKFDRPLTRVELLELVPGSFAILSLLTDRIDREVIDVAGTGLKVISNYAVGFDNVDTAYAKDKGIIVTNTPCEEVNIAVAEHTWALILASMRRVVEADEVVKRGGYNGWEPDIFLGHSLQGKNLGIVGLGRIGSMVARIAKGFGMQVSYNKHTRDEALESELGITFLQLDELFSSSDVVTIHVPLTEETRGMINKNTLAKMKQGAILVNTARGPIVNEHELAEFVRSGHIAGAGLDVFENEPNIYPELLGMQNVILTPHIASATVEARQKMGELAVTAILDVIAGKTPVNIVTQK